VGADSTNKEAIMLRYVLVQYGALVQLIQAPFHEEPGIGTELMLDPQSPFWEVIKVYNEEQSAQLALMAKTFGFQKLQSLFTVTVTDPIGS
jgi:hypothetical protein